MTINTRVFDVRHTQAKSLSNGERQSTDLLSSSDLLKVRRSLGFRQNIKLLDGTNIKFSQLFTLRNDREEKVYFENERNNAQVANASINSGSDVNIYLSSAKNMKINAIIRTSLSKNLANNESVVNFVTQMSIGVKSDLEIGQLIVGLKNSFNTKEWVSAVNSLVRLFSKYTNGTFGVDKNVIVSKLQSQL